jgi:2-keto-4-pentenoate hydratase/2-oxohepta-3-ene-1,7-dioic acid hydratase in catechol pathway
MCSPQAIVGPGDAIVLDSHDKRIEFEAEIAIVIGKRARNVPAAEAASVVLGYTCANDVSNRDLQLKDKQFTRAKSFDTYKPMGPWIETDLDPDVQSIRLRQNDIVRQDSVTSDMIFPTPFIIEFVSSIMTLEPGDVIITGTPSGVGPMKSGDRIEIEISGIGKLENVVQ